MARRINKIIIHYTASPDVSAKTIDGWHKLRGWSGIAYHKVIRKNGKVENGRHELLVGAHCRGYNTHSLGVVLTGSNLMSWYPSSSQYNSLIKVIQEWQGRYSVKRIYFHNELGKTSCPGRLDKNKILSMLTGGDTVTSDQEQLFKKLLQELKDKSNAWSRLDREETIAQGNRVIAELQKLNKKLDSMESGVNIEEVVKAVGEKLSQ